MQAGAKLVRGCLVVFGAGIKKCSLILASIARFGLSAAAKRSKLAVARVGGWCGKTYYVGMIKLIN